MSSTDQADLARLGHMRDAAAEALRFAEGKSRADLDQSRMLILAVLKDLEIIGEAASRVNPATRRRHESVPWDDIIAMRNRLIHGYFDVNLDLVWETISNDIPLLLVELDTILDPPEHR